MQHREQAKDGGQMGNLLGYVGIALVTVLAFFATYYLKVSASIEGFVWILWILCVLGFALLTRTGRYVFNFAKEAKIELQKVVWPTRQETVQTTGIVMVMVAVTGFFLWGIDSLMIWVIGKLTHLG